MSSEDDNQFDIAIIGMAGRFPGASNINEFWANILAGKVSNTTFSKEELLEAGVVAAQVEDPDYVCLAPVLDDAEFFDAEFFGYSPHEARLMDPQQRQLLEVSWQALENAGYDPSRTAARIATFAGTAMNTYLLHTGLAEHFFEEYLPTLLGSDKDFLATRIAYKLGLTGPALTVQSACSTSVIATHLACQNLLNHESDMALVGAAAVRAPLKVGHLYEEGSVFSSDGICRPFDDSANGTVFGSGVGMLVLKRLTDALEDNDHICAVIKGSAINNDGDTKSDFTAPSINKQAEAVADAYASADITADTISYIEAHGTGTYLGDPIEIEALTRAFRVDTNEEGFCGIGSVKSNIGHLDAAAGVASMIKVVLSLQNEQLPATANFKKSNTQIDFESSPFYVVDKKRDWISADSATPLRAGVTSLGMGGTNGHVVLEQATNIDRPPSVKSGRPHIFPLSAKSENSLNKNTDNLASFLDKHPQTRYEDVAFTLQQGRQSFNKRKAIIANYSESTDGFMLDGGLAISVPAGLAETEKTVVFMFPGQGAQFIGMGQDLYNSEPIFKKLIDQARDILLPISGVDLVDAMYGDPGDTELVTKLNQTSLTQPALYAVEYAYARLFESWGIVPQALVGHSIGEYVAAAIAGVFSYEEGLKIVVERGRIMQAAQTGSMLSVPLPADEMKAIIGDALDIGVVNSDAACVVSGDSDLIDKLCDDLQEREIDFQRLRTSHAFHSRLMQAAASEFEQSIGQFELKAPSIPFISNVSGTWISDEEAVSASYWASQLRKTVQFSKGMQTLFERKATAFLECGPSTTLSQLVNMSLDKGDKHIGVSASRHPKVQQCDQMIALGAFARLWTVGVNVDWEQVAEPGGQRTPLPSYHFDGKPFWYERPVDTKNTSSQSLLNKESDKDKWFWRESWTNSAAILEKSNEADLTILIEDGKQISASSVAILESSLSNSLQHMHPHEIQPGIASIPSTGFVRIVYIPSCHGSDGNVDMLLETMELVRQIDQGTSCEIELVLLTCAASGVLDTQIQSSQLLGLSGLMRVVANEYPELTIRLLDVPNLTDASTLASLVAKTESYSGSLLEAYSNGRWWSSTFTQMSLPPKAVASSLEAECHVIVGAFGGVGRVMATHLASISKTLVITGTVCPPEASWAEVERDANDSKALAQIAFIKELRSSGVEVVPVGMDITKKDDVNSLFAVLKQRNLNPKYIFNMAGANNDGLLSMKDIQDARNVLEPKILGTNNLLDNLAEHSETKLVLFSSTAAWMGVVGQSDYSAANEYQLSVGKYSDYRDKVVSIAWSGWAGVGMFGRMDDSKGKDEASVNAIDATDAIDILAKVLSYSDISSIVVSPVSVNSIIEAKRSSLNNANVGDSNTHLDPPEQADQSPESIVETLWRDSLGVDTLNLSDNFYALGGNSLMITQLVSKLRKTQKINIALKEATAKPVLSDWIELCRKAMDDSQQVLTSTSAGDEQVKNTFSLSPGIFRYLDRRQGASFKQWNLAVMLECVASIDEAAFREAVTAIYSHHSMLRGNVLVGSQHSQIKVKDLNSDIPLSTIDLSSIDVDQLSSTIELIASEAQGSFDMAAGDLFKVVHIQCPEGAADRILLLTHHFISDGLSWTLTLADLQNAYKSAVDGNAIVLPQKTMEYSSWVDALTHTANADDATALAKTWAELPWDKLKSVSKDTSDSSTNINSSGNHVTAQLALEPSDKIIKGGCGPYTPAEIGIVALSNALASWNNNSIVLMDVLGSGRDLNDQHDVARTVGFFNSYSPIVLDSQPNSDDTVSLPNMMSQLRSQLGKGIEYDLLRYMSNDPVVKGLMADLPKAEVLFNYIGQLKTSNDALLDPELFSIANESAGDTHLSDGLRDHMLAVRVEVVDGLLDVTIVYSENLHTKHQIANLMENVLSELQTISSLETDDT